MKVLDLKSSGVNENFNSNQTQWLDLLKKWEAP